MPGTFKRPDYKELFGQEEVKKEDAKPARTWNKPGGNNSAFQQIMRMEMGRAAETGPRKVNQDAYKEAVKAQAQQHAESLSKGPSSGAGGGEGQWAVEEKQMSKHAKRRAKKKNKKHGDDEQQQHHQ